MTVNAGNILTLAGGIDMSAATADLALNCDYVLGGPTVWNIATGRTLALGGIVSGDNNATKQGPGKLILSAANTYSGATAVTGGTLELGASDVIPDGVGKGSVDVSASCTLDMKGFSDTLNAVTGLGVIDNTAATTTSTLTVGGNTSSFTLAGVIQNTGTDSKINLAKIGSGIVTLQGTNTFTGSVSVTAGNLTIGTINPLGNISGLSIGGATLGCSANNAVISAPITLTGNANIMTQASGILTSLNGAIGGTGNVTFNTGNNTLNGDNRVSLGAASNFTGNVTITTSSVTTANNMTVQLGIDDAIPTASVLTLDGQNGNGTSWADFNLNGFNQTLAGLSNIARTTRLQRVFNSSATASTLTINNADPYTFGGRLGKASGDNFGLTKNGAGTFTIAGVNSYTGATTITAGTLALGAANTLPNTTAVTLGAATLDAMAAGNEVTGTLAVTGAATIKLAAGANLAFADSSAETWTGTLVITGPFVSGQSIRFGVDINTGLTPAQLATISIPAFTGIGLNAAGYLTATSTDPFLAWSNGAAFDADANNDDVENGLAWLLGAADKDANATALLPAVSQITGDLKLTFRCLKVAGRNGAILAVRHSSDLGTADAWVSAEVPDADSTVNDVVFDTTDDGAYINVVATIPAAQGAGGKLFGQVRAQSAP